MKRLMLLPVCLFCLSSFSPAQTAKNGYTWNEGLNSDDKTFYVAGVLDCIRSLKPNALDSLLPKNVTAYQIVKSLDDFYSDYNNLSIAIFDGICISILKLSNASEEKIKWTIRYARADQATRQAMDKEMENRKHLKRSK